MDSLKFCDVSVVKANSISKYRRIQRITALFRLVELFVFLVIVVRFCSQFHFSVKSSGEHFRGVMATLISPRFVFVIGNVIVAVLLLKSRRFSAENGGKGTDFYDEYVGKCRGINHRTSSNGKLGDMEMKRSKSEKVLRVSQVEERQRELRRSTTERCQRTANAGRRNAAANGSITSYCPEDEMSGEEFRQAVEVFIARQQRLLREEEALSDV